MDSVIKLIPTLLLFIFGLLCFYFARCAVKKGVWEARGCKCARENNAPLFWAGILSYIGAGIFLIFKGIEACVK